MTTSSPARGRPDAPWPTAWLWRASASCCSRPVRGTIAVSSTFPRPLPASSARSGAVSWNRNLSPASRAAGFRCRKGGPWAAVPRSMPWSISAARPLIMTAGAISAARDGAGTTCCRCSNALRPMSALPDPTMARMGRCRSPTPATATRCRSPLSAPPSRPDMPTTTTSTAKPRPASVSSRPRPRREGVNPPPMSFCAPSRTVAI